LERADRSRQPAHREDPPRRTRLPQLPQLPAPATTALRRHQLADSPNRTNPRPSTTLDRVEPNFAAAGALSSPDNRRATTVLQPARNAARSVAEAVTVAAAATVTARSIPP